jgi:hypothetical protein
MVLLENGADINLKEKKSRRDPSDCFYLFATLSQQNYYLDNDALLMPKKTKATRELSRENKTTHLGQLTLLTCNHEDS